MIMMLIMKTEKKICELFKRFLFKPKSSLTFLSTIQLSKNLLLEQNNVGNLEKRLIDLKIEFDRNLSLAQNSALHNHI